MNTDGSTKGCPGLAGGGGVLRDCRGGFIKAFAANYGVCTAYKAEMKVVLQGLKMARDLGVSKLIIQMDNLACIQVLKNEDYHGGECFQIIKQCWTLLRCEDWDIKLMHCYREANRVADWLANRGAIQDLKVEFFQEASQGLARLLHDDVAGVALPRVVNV